MNLFSRKKPYIDTGLAYINQIVQFVDETVDLFYTEVYEPSIRLIKDMEEKNINKTTKIYHPSMCKIKLEIKGYTYNKIEYINGEAQLDRYNILANNGGIYGELCTSLLEEDGDRLDFVVWIPRPFSAEMYRDVSVLKVYPLLTIDLEDEGFSDKKVICVPADLLLHYDISLRFRISLAHFVANTLLCILMGKGLPAKGATQIVRGLLNYTETVTYVKTRLD